MWCKAVSTRTSHPSRQSEYTTSTAMIMKKWKCLSIEAPLMSTNKYEYVVSDTPTRMRHA